MTNSDSDFKKNQHSNIRSQFAFLFVIYFDFGSEREKNNNKDSPRLLLLGVE